jgi:hypothetical protein
VDLKIVTIYVLSQDYAIIAGSVCQSASPFWYKAQLWNSKIVGTSVLTNTATEDEVAYVVTLAYTPLQKIFSC